jgi:hypothetical protein
VFRTTYTHYGLGCTLKQVEKKRAEQSTMHEIYVGFVDRTSDGEAIEVEKLPMACVCVCFSRIVPMRARSF